MLISTETCSKTSPVSGESLEKNTTFPIVTDPPIIFPSITPPSASLIVKSYASRSTNAERTSIPL